MSADLLANAERPETHRPTPSREPLDANAGYWLGSAGGSAEHWRARALAAEREVARLRRALARWRFRP